MEENYKRLIEIKRFRLGSDEFISNELIREISFEIYINQRKLVTLSCIPGNLEELAFGFLYSESIILSQYEIKYYEFMKEDKAIYFYCDIPFERINNYILSKEKSNTCPVNFRKMKNAFDNLTINRNDLLKWIDEYLFDTDPEGIYTCLYKAAIILDNQIIKQSKDISVFNAIDKASGSFFIDHKSPANSFLLINGCISSEIVKKSIRLGIPLIISIYDPTSEAIRLAWDNKIFLLTFYKNRDFDLFTGFNQIKII